MILGNYLLTPPPNLTLTLASDVGQMLGQERARCGVPGSCYSSWRLLIIQVDLQFIITYLFTYCAVNKVIRK